MNKISFLLVFTFLITISGFSQNLKLDPVLTMDPSVRTGVLPNGMKYYIQRNALPAKRAELRLALNAGSMLENDDQQGLAHFLEHMCFNGTKNFRKSELVDFLERAGVKFGAHLNAYTSFDETVYMLQLPTDNETVFLKGFQVLEDWAHNVSMDSVEIEKERGVVISERRGRLGAGERMRQQWWPVFYEGSRYADRLPIGQLEVLENFSHKALKDFYGDWYRPDLMAICVAGDINPDEVEKIIVDKFSGISSASKAVHRNFEVPDHKGLRIAICKDEEATNTNLRLTYLQDHKSILTEEDMRQSIIMDLFNTMLGNRFDDLIERGDTPFSSAFSGYSSLVRTKDAFFASANVKETEILKGLKMLLLENQRIKKFGFQPLEFERAKKEILSSLEKAYTERDKAKSGTLVNKLVQGFLSGTPVVSTEFRYLFIKKHLAQISLVEVSALSKKWITENGDNATLVLSAPSKPGLVLPEENELKAVIEKVENELIEPLVEEADITTLLPLIPAKGRILKEKKKRDSGITEWTLSNGAKVQFKPTTFKNDEVLCWAYSPGGFARFPADEHYQGAWASALVNESGIADIGPIALKRYLSDKFVACTPIVAESFEGLRGNYIQKDAETFFQLLHLYFSSPRIDEVACKTLMERQKLSLINRNKNPEVNFRDSINFTYYGDNPRRKPQTVLDIDKINPNRALDIFKDRFADAADFIFFFTGNIMEKDFRTFIETYIASLPSNYSNEKKADPNANVNVRSINKKVFKGKEPKSQVNLVYFNKIKYSRAEILQVQAMCEVLKIKLREKIREEKGGTYGVSVSANMTDFPKPECRIQISFGCAPERAEELTKHALTEIATMSAQETEMKNLLKVKETFMRERETELKENDFWLSSMSAYHQNKWNPEEIADYEKRLRAITCSSVQKTAKNFLKKGTLMNFTMLPEPARP
ncbi:MAG: M16 family metallopeptidase [Saprospiraceae bacterium]